jgi:hypothetical protein
MLTCPFPSLKWCSGAILVRRKFGGASFGGASWGGANMAAQVWGNRIQLFKFLIDANLVLVFFNPLFHCFQLIQHFNLNGIEFPFVHIVIFFN